MSSNRVLIYIISILLILPLVHAQNFEIFADSGIEDLCPGTTGLFTDAIRNNGDYPLSFSVTKTGTASSFSTSVPQGFTLLPNQIKTIYTYVSPRSTTNIGTYSIAVKATANGESREITHNFLVKDCFEYSLEALTPEKSICPSESETFEFRLQNNGQFTETYNLMATGEYASSVVLSTDKITLNSGESRTIFAFATSTLNDVGRNDFTIRSTPVNSRTVRTADSTLVVDSCYNFDVQTERDLANICEHTLETIPITIENTGSTTNRFILEVDGPLWANLERNTLNIAPNSQQTVNLILNPDYGVEGSFEVRFTAQSEKGEVRALNTFNVNVKKCHGVSVDIERSSDVICNSLENTYNVRVRNIGESAKEYFFSIDGPDWTSLDRSSANLAVAQEEQLTLTVNPPFNTPIASYLINIESSASDTTKIADSDSIEISTVSRDECFQAFIGVDDKDLEVFYDSSATAPIVIENKGTYSATYDLAVTGTASNFVYLNPGSVTIDAGKSEVIYLYIAPSVEVADGDYSVTVSARTGDSAVLASERIDITVSESEFEEPDITGGAVVDTERKSVFSAIVEFIANIFGGEREEAPEEEELPEDITGEVITNVTENITEEEVEEEEVEPIENITEEVNETEIENVTEEPTEEISGELTSRNTLLGVGESESFLINNEEHIILVDSRETNTILITVSSNGQTFALEIGEVKKVDLDEDGAYDLQVTFNGFNDEGKADLTYEKISEQVPTEDLEEVTGEAVATGFFASLSQYRFHILGVIVIVIILYFVFKRDYHKKIVNFFEEEIEEEAPKVKEEIKVEKKPEKKELKREEKPKPKKQVTEDTEDEIEIKGLEDKKEDDDKEDFIIEFDDEDDK